ncbi:MAG: hypothetical protein ACI8PZ_000453 [Myxococcota bacterium]
MSGPAALVVGYSWEDGAPVLRIRRDQPGVWRLEGSVCFRVRPGRRCTGYGGVDGFHPCPERASLAGGHRCDACAARDAFRVCMICDGFRCGRLSPAVERHCRRTRVLYLACFGADALKVGTAIHPRRDQRIVEQGPLAAARVAMGDGRIIKQMETTLSRAGFTETMRRSRKLALLDGGMDAEEATSRVRTAAAELRDVIPRAMHVLLHPPEFVRMPPLAVESRQIRVNALPIQEGTVIEGQVVGAVGHVLFLQDDAGKFALDLGSLKGRVLEPDPDGPRRRPTVQLGLF